MTEMTFKKINKNISGVFLLTAFAKKLHPLRFYFSFVFIFIGLIFLHIQQVSALSTTSIISATGGTITTISQNGMKYKVHTFTSSGTFQVTSGSGRVWYLVVAGGGAGGGGGAPGGGGGGGGFRTNNSYNYAVSSGSYTVTVGAGGTYPAGNGNNSVFATITSIGGGAGCDYYNGNAAAVGGSGGGGCGYGNPTAAAGTAGQGNAGGNGQYFVAYEAGGGGGAGAVGATATNNQSGNGGIGLPSSISGSSVYYSGGGGASGTDQGAAGGVGGTGGGGNGRNGGTAAQSGTANTGGGGGAAHTAGGAAGGSGVVIIRYPVSALTKPIQKGGLVARWTFDTQDISGTTVLDKGGSGANGLMVNSPTSGPGKFGQALTFNGTNFISATSSSLNLNNNFTISTWIKTTGNRDTGGHGVVTWGENATGKRRSLFLWYGGGGSNYNQVYFSGYGAAANYTSGVRIDDGLWHHVVITLNSSNVAQIYVDGVSTGTSSPLSLNSFSYSATYTGFAIEPGEYFTGSVDDVRIYNRVLTASEVASLYKETETKYNTSPVKGLSTGLVSYWTFDGKNLTNATATDSGSIGNDGTISGNRKTAIGKFGQAFNFDGSTSITVPSSASYTAVQSRSLWVYVRGAVSGNQYLIDEGGNNNWIQILSGRVRAGPGLLDSLATVVENKWYHIVVTFDGSIMNLYINGVLDSGGSAAGAAAGAITIGRYGGGGYNLNGIIDDVRIYNRALSATEVMQLYKMGAR